MNYEERFNKLESKDLLEKNFLAQKKPSYWQQAWIKLSSNPRAIISLGFIIVLILFSTIGPLIWTINPSFQDLSQVSQAPALRKTILLVDVENWNQPYAEKQDLKSESRLSNLRLAEGSVAHTESIKLIWEPDVRANYYQIYRHNFKPSGEQDLGLPLGKTESNLQNFYEDKLKLEEQKYFYSVVAYDNKDQVIVFQTITVKPVFAVSKRLAEKNVQNKLWEKDETMSNHILLPSHPMGTDFLGRDMMARLMLAGQTSLLISIVASVFFVLLGGVYGAVSAYIGGRVDNFMMRFSDFIIALPFLLFMILLKVSFGLGPGDSGIGVMIFSLIILSWPSCARLVRAQVLLLREQNYVLAARINGASIFYIVRRHLLPNTLSIIFVSLSFAIPAVILTEAFLSFIGLGVVPPTPSWGSMCQEGIKTFLFHPHELIFPSAFIGLTVLAFNLLGDGLRDALDVTTEIHS